MKKPIIVGNWKLNGNKELINKFFIPLNKFLEKYYKKSTVVIAPPILYAAFIQHIFSSNKRNFFIGAQNTDLHSSGPFTGEISPSMLIDVEVDYVIIGHSERRLYHQEDNESTAKKFYILKKENLIPIVCIGETLKEKRDNQIQEKCKNQIDEIFKICGSKHAFNNSIIAYEPIWAIGSGRSADPEEVQRIANFIREYIELKANSEIKNFFIQYGGSVTPDNVKQLISQKDIDGFLIGGASLQLQEFTKIIKIINQMYS
ncbi:triose-phosphate isomerase [Buchnera aphidicola]|uniref:triose-phosphate isomerase n=1 Tax=Buchnera aphidicola TaxID=9 RepID=UPI00094DEA2C|nr:triose-phosphate isomerase [Buchnera aphidicola]